MQKVPPLNLIFSYPQVKRILFFFLLAEKACYFLFSGVCVLFFLREEEVSFTTSTLPFSQIDPSKT